MSLLQEHKALVMLVDSGEFLKASIAAFSLLDRIKNLGTKNENYYDFLFNIAATLIDIGMMQPSVEASQEGLVILEANKTHFLAKNEAAFYYNLGNAKANLIKEHNPFSYSFETIEQLVDLKSCIWKALKSSHKQGSSPPEFKVNLANSLKKQFRVVEALQCYNDVNRLDLDIPQAWTNRSESLILLNTISGSYSIQLVEQVAEGYERAAQSNQIPPQWAEFYREKALDHFQKATLMREEISATPDLHDKEKTELEYRRLSKFRRFCLDNSLTLSEHGLYCPCAASAIDDLTIPTTSNNVFADFVVPMGLVLNRLKSEFSFARRLYYEYFDRKTPHQLQHESCYSEFFNDELLGIDVEKLRTSFRLCFGILDKIASAICELYDLHPPKGHVYFQSFWQLDQPNRREKFEAIKTPGLLALYSIATDLNDKKDGEWAFYKQWRNDLEHKFVVVHKSDKVSEVYSVGKYLSDLVHIPEQEFIHHLAQLLQLTRSAIFSFVFTIRENALQAGEVEKHEEKSA